MATRPIAVVDASVIVLYAEPEPEPEDKAEHQRWLNTREHIKRLRAEGVLFVVPAPTMVELEIGGDASHRLALALGAKQDQLLIEAFDNSAAPIAGKMLRKGHKAMVKENPGPGRRPIVKFDALIAAMAHALGAKWLLTANARDFKRMLAEVESSVMVLDVTESQGQQVLPLKGIAPA
jgi:predicted nucleic acid-binding protein